MWPFRKRYADHVLEQSAARHQELEIEPLTDEEAEEIIRAETERAKRMRKAKRKDQPKRLAY